MNGPQHPSAVDLEAKISALAGFWSPGVVARFNGHEVMVVKVLGEFVWHAHDETDDFFLVLSGRIDVDLPEKTVSLGPGQLLIVPAGVPHRPRAAVETHLLLIEKDGTPNTGDPRTAAPKPEI